MLKRLFMFAAALLAAQFLFAQELLYPYQKMIENGDYEKAEKRLEKELEKPYADSYYAAFALYSQKNYAKFDTKKAYDFLEKSEKLFKQADARERAKLTKNGFSAKLYAKKYAEISVVALENAHRKRTVAAYDYFLQNYWRAGAKILAKAQELKSALAYEIACKVGTESAYSEFIRDYPSSAELPKAIARRDAVAFARAKRAGTQEAYEQFLKTYPKASQTKKAWNEIYRLTYNEVLAVDNERAYRAYVEKYPKSPYRADAEKRAAELELKLGVVAGDWLSYRQFVENNPTQTAMVQYMREEIWQIARKTHDIGPLDYGANTFSGALRDSCLLILYDIYAAMPTYELWANFFKKYDLTNACQTLQNLKSKFDKVDPNASPEQFIQAAAPATPAYVALQSLVKPALKAKNWSAALAEVRKYESAFGNDHSYRNLLNMLADPSEKSITLQSLGSNVNTKDGSEYSVVLSADGERLLFCGVKRRDNLGGEDIFVSQKTNGVWGKAKLLEGVNSANANEAPEAISADGTQLIMFRDGELCMAQKGVNGWNPPQKLPENINFANWQADAMISSDGQAILFAASQKTPYQLHNPDNSVYDNSNIFVSVKDLAGNWGKAIDLGWAINTPFSDRSPMLHPDMKTLYFCSAGHGSMGGTDVFMTRRLRDDSWTEWSEPVSLGKEINSVENECWYKITTEGTKAYFSLQDIFCMDIPESMRPNPVATISGRLIGANGQPIAASIKWEDLELGEVIGECKSDPADGRFFIVLPMGRNYGYFVDDNDLFPISDNLDLRDKNENVVINRDFSVWSLSQMIASGTPMPMNNLFFDVADATLLESSISELTRVLHLIKRIGGKIEISGHTDDTGNATSNQKLSEARAMSARNFLVNAGYDPNLIKVVGYGESRPVDTNKTAEGRQRNRRVEIKFLK